MLRWIDGFALASVHGVLFYPAAVYFHQEESWLHYFYIISLLVILLTTLYLTRLLILDGPPTCFRDIFTNLIHNYLCNKYSHEKCKEIPLRKDKLISRDELETEVSLLGETFHASFVTPWFSAISADDKYSREIKCVLEDTILSALNAVNQKIDATDLFRVLSVLYLQHYKRFFTTVQQVSGQNCQDPNFSIIPTDEIRNAYIHMHPALTPRTKLQQYCENWAHTVLTVHLPEEVTNCELITLTIRDFIAEWLLNLLTEQLREPNFIINFLLSLFEEKSNPEEETCCFQVDAIVPEKTFSYMHSLSAIAEENSFDLQELENYSQKLIKNVNSTTRDCSVDKWSCKRVNLDMDKMKTPKHVKTSILGKIAESKDEEADKSVACALGKLMTTTAGPIVADQCAFPFLSNNLRHNVHMEHQQTIDAIIQIKSNKSHMRRSCSCDSFLCANQFRSVSTLGSVYKQSFSCENIPLNNAVAARDPMKERKLVKMSSFEEYCQDVTEQSSLPEAMQDSTTSCVSLKTGESLDRSDQALNELSSSDDTSQALASSADNVELSPIYEESEDLASTIAKLRFLLSERQSQHSLGSQSSFGSSESEPKSAQSDPGRYNLEKSRFNFFHKDSSGSLASVKSFSSTDSHSQVFLEEDLPEASDVPLDGRIFINISVPSAEMHTEANGLQYYVYIIHYDAIYSCDMHSQITSAEPTRSPETKMVLQTNIVKRRFCEFMDLHSTIESEASLKIVLKGIKAPSKWLNLCFNKSDSLVARTQLLEKYLQSLIQRTELNVSEPVKEFLSYGTDSADMFIKKPLDIPLPRLDKLLARKVSGVFHSLKTALPTFDNVEEPAETPALHPKNNVDKNCVEKSKECLKVDIESEEDLNLDVTAEDGICDMEEALKSSILEGSQSAPLEFGTEAKEYEDSSLNCESSEPNLLKQLLQTIDSHSANPWNKNCITSLWKQIDQADAFCDISHDKGDVFNTCVEAMAQVLSLSNSSRLVEIFFSVFSQWFAAPLAPMMQNILDDLLSEDNVKTVFECIRNQLQQSPNKNLHHSNPPLELKDRLKSYIPDSVATILGQELIEKQMNLLVGSLQQPPMNQDLVLNVLDLLLTKLCA